MPRAEASPSSTVSSASVAGTASGWGSPMHVTPPWGGATPHCRWAARAQEAAQEEGAAAEEEEVQYVSLDIRQEDAKALVSTIEDPAAPPAPTAATDFDCSKDCAEQCQRPDRCLRDEAQQKVQAFLSITSLDSMLNLASESLEQRTKARFERGTP